MARRKVHETSALSKNLSVIRRAEQEEEKTIKVAAYCRVSKDIEEQETSIQTQMESYDRIIREHQGWELAGIYADKGKTGTIRAKRPQFEKMIADAKAGKIDMILAKSASRFARNTVDLLTVTRELKDYGVGVFFEKEKINTLSLQSEMLLTVYAAFAQEESRSISENMKRGIRQRFEIGIPKFAMIYGLERTGKDEWGIVEEEAAVIRTIFELAVQGYGSDSIAEYLNEKGVPGPCQTRETKGWYQTTILEMIRNEKYAGDCCMQKYYTVDHLSHESVRNTESKVQQYYAKDHHPAIVPRGIFEEANCVTMMKASTRGVIMYPYYGRLLCPHCGKPMVKANLGIGKNPTGWLCGGMDIGTLYTERTKCPPYWVKEPFLTNSVREAILGLEWEDMTPADAAMVREVQEELKTRETVEYGDLRKLVQSMTFPDWDTLEVTWVWGEKSRAGYSVSTPVEYPSLQLRWENGACMVGPMEITNNNVAQIEKAFETRIAKVKNVQIIEDTDCMFKAPPLVKLVKKNEGA